MVRYTVASASISSLYKIATALEGIDLEVKDFADYTQPNPALSEGELDINQFQHIVYLAEYNVANDDDVVPLVRFVQYLASSPRLERHRPRAVAVTLVALRTISTSFIVTSNPKTSCSSTTATDCASR